MKKVILLICATLLVSLSFSQQTKGVVKGAVLDAADTRPLVGASISLSWVDDSLVLSSSLTSDSGVFEIRNLNGGTYRMSISYQGYEAYTKMFTITSKDPVMDIGTLRIEKAYKTLSEVVVKDKSPIRVKGDTTSYNADAFKTRPNATAQDLLKKLPGVQVDRSGAVTAQGEGVQKVYVDGKEYFGEDLEQATKNLTADMIDQVQVFDDKSEQSKFSGVDDGSRNKAINLKLKKEAKKGLTGRAYLGQGAGRQYTAGVRSNYFKGASQLSLIASSNNINRSGYTASDLAGGGGASGITKASSFGINYRDTWSKRIDVAGSYSFNRRNNTNLRESFRQTFLSNSTLLTNRQTDYNQTNSSHRFTQKIVYTIDSMNSIIYRPSLALQRSGSSTIDTLFDFLEDSLASYKRSNSKTLNGIEGKGHSWANNIIWRRKFNRKGRTFSASLSSTRNLNERNGTNSINSLFYNRAGDPSRQRITDYRSSDESRTGNYNLSLSYTEPLSLNSLVELNYSNNRSRSLSDRRTYSFNPATNQYDELNDTLSNNFEQVATYNRVGANFRDVKENYNYQLGLSLQQSVLTGNNLTNKTDLTQRYTNFIPTVSFNYQLARNRSMRMAYRGRNNQPSVLQLQDVPDLSNYPYIRRGNPGLGQEFMHNFMLSYNFFDTKKFRNVYASLFYTGTRNKIVNALQINNGEQILTPVNVRGTYSLSGSFGYGIPIKRMEGGNLSTTTRIGYNQLPGFVNEERNLAKSIQLGEDINLSFTYKENLDLDIQAGIGLNSVKHTIQSAYNNFYLSHNYALDAAYTFLHHLMLATTIDFTGYSGRDTAPGGNFVMWNFSLSRPVLKDNRGELTLSVNNLLNQSDNIMRNVYENVIEDVYNQTQKRYALLTFTYHFKGLRGK